jgi:hypothetical protein
MTAPPYIPRAPGGCHSGLVFVNISCEREHCQRIGSLKSRGSRKGGRNVKLAAQAEENANVQDRFVSTQ